MASLKNKIKDSQYDPQQYMRKELGDTLEYINKLHKDTVNNQIKIYPKTNIQYYLKTPKMKKELERAIISLWKESHSLEENKKTIAKSSS